MRLRVCGFKNVTSESNQEVSNEKSEVPHTATYSMRYEIPRLPKTIESAIQM